MPVQGHFLCVPPSLHAANPCCVPLAAFPGPQPQALTVEEARERQNRLAKMRALLFYHEAKAKRMKKIKSKEYRRKLKKSGACLPSCAACLPDVWSILLPGPSLPACLPALLAGCLAACLLLA